MAEVIVIMEILFPIGYLLIAIFAAAHVGSHNRSPIKEPPEKAATDAAEPEAYRKEALAPSNRWVPIMLFAVIVVCAFQVVSFILNVEFRLDAARGTPRIGMTEGRYRVLYRNPDGSGALIKSLDSGTTRYYANPESSPPRDPNFQYCFAVRVGDCTSYAYTITCPSE